MKHKAIRPKAEAPVEGLPNVCVEQPKIPFIAGLAHFSEAQSKCAFVNLTLWT